MNITRARIVSELRNIALALLLVAAVTGLMLILVTFAHFSHDSIVYVLPVIVAAVRWSVIAAIIAAIAGVGASAFFFYPPIFSFSVSDPSQVIDLSLFVFVAILTSELASQLSQARARAQGERLRQALIDSVSHELRTPLVSILGAATVLHDAPALAASPHLRELTQLVREESERLNNDIENLLDASRISSDGVHPKFEWADPADIVNSAIERCRTRLAHHKIKLDLTAEPPLVHADSVLVRQALIQILDNARKYSPHNSVIEVSLHSRGDRIGITVRDHGAGLTGDERYHLWERFFRSERLSALASGSGLGLWIAKEFIAANRGTIAAASDGIGKGTAITIELPQGAGPVVKEGMSSEDRDE